MKLTPIALAMHSTSQVVRACARRMSIGSPSPALRKHQRCGKPLLQSDPGISLAIRLLLSAMIQADQH